MPSVVISASRVEESVGKSGSSVTLISQEEIQAREAVTLDDVLRGVEGVHIQSQYGRADLSGTLSLRGSERNGVLLLIDGIEVNFPFDRGVTTGPVDLFNIGHVEVVRGPQSALYGSQAMGGVIQVFTAVPEQGTRWTLLEEGGNLRTRRGGVSYAQAGDFAYQLSYDRYDTHGMTDHSAIQSDQGGMNLRWRTGNGILRTSFLYRQTDEEYHTVFALFGPFDPMNIDVRPYQDPNAEYRQTWNLVGVSYSQSPLPWLDYRLGVSHHEEIFVDDNPEEFGVVDYHPAIVDIRVEGTRDRIELQQNLKLQEKDILTLLLEYTREEAQKRERSNIDSLGLGPVVDQPPVSGTQENKAIAVQLLIDSMPYDRLTVGWRMDRHSLFGQAVSPRVSFAHELAQTGTLLRLGYGQGIRAPSMEENFNPIKGNRDLESEENRSYEIGISQPFPWKSLNLSWTFYRASYENLITQGVNPDDGVSPLYINVGHAVIKGHESLLSMSPDRNWILKVTYSRLQTWDQEADQPLAFRPNYTLFVNVRYKRGRLQVNGELHQVGESLNAFSFLRDDNGTPFGDHMPGYKRVDLSGSYNLVNDDRKVDLYCRIDNLFDNEIEDFSGFPLPGLMYLAGLRAEF